MSMRKYWSEILGRGFLATTVVVAVLSAGSALAQEKWAPPEPSVKGLDWVQLVSGEWLTGTIDLVRDEKMEFDSDKLDDLVLDWRDIKAFRSPRTLTYVFFQTRRHQIVITGTAVMDEGTIRIRTLNGEVQEFPRRTLLSILEGKQREWNYWSIKANLGLTVRTGNTEQKDINSTVKIRREAARSRLDVGYAVNFGTIDSVRTIDNTRGTASLAFFVSRKFFVTPFWGEIYSDEFQNIDYRASYSANAGYYFFRTGDLEWFATLGGGYRTTRYLSVEAGQKQHEETGSITPATSFDMDVTDDIEVTFDYTVDIGVPDPKQTTHHAVLYVSVDFLKDIFELTGQVTYDRVESPKANADGVVPERDDIRMYFGFGIDL